ncbi:hypothetical protein DRN93_01205 [archaeon]|nr:MAG: hypothetical protein DRN93_01205 [archaeon]
MAQLPISIQKQAEEARRLEEEIVRQAQEQEETPSEEEPQTEEEVEPTTDESPTSEPVGEPTQDAEEEHAEEDWEHKYRVLQGKYNAEVPRLHDEVKSLKQDNDFLKGKLELLERLMMENAKQEPTQPQTPTETQEPEPPEVVQLREDFPDIYKGVVKLVERLVAKQTQIEEKLSSTEENLAQTQAKLFYSALSRQVPDWEALNTSPDFINWLQAREPYTGMSRHELLLQAFQSGDADRVATFFLDYKREMGLDSVETPAQPQEKPRQPRNIVPPQGRTSGASSGRRSSKYYRQSEIEEFYRKLALGKIPQQEAKQREAEYIKAMQEGRVLFNK